jgi:hypothetical protein
VWVYDPATQRKKYIRTCPQKGVKSKRHTQDPKVYAYAAEYHGELAVREAFERGPVKVLTLRELRPLWVEAKTHEYAEKRWRETTRRHNVERTDRARARRRPHLRLHRTPGGAGVGARAPAVCGPGARAGELGA